MGRLVLLAFIAAVFIVTVWAIIATVLGTLAVAAATGYAA